MEPAKVQIAWKSQPIQVPEINNMKQFYNWTVDGATYKMVGT